MAAGSSYVFCCNLARWLRERSFLSLVSSKLPGKIGLQMLFKIRIFNCLKIPEKRFTICSVASHSASFISHLRASPSPAAAVSPYVHLGTAMALWEPSLFICIILQHITRHLSPLLFDLPHTLIPTHILPHVETSIPQLLEIFCFVS